jgi:hypothetical protein
MNDTIYCFDPRNNGHCYTAEERPDLVRSNRSMAGMRATSCDRYSPTAYADAGYETIYGRKVPNLAGVLDDVWGILTGKPQSWYDRVSADQSALAVRSAAINAIGQGPWDQVRASYLAQTQGPDVDFLSFGEINAGIDVALKALIITKDHVPSDSDIAAAEAFNAQYGRYVDYVTSMLPELQAQVQADTANAQATLGQGKLTSPSAVGQQAFVDEVERRAAILGAGLGLGALAYLAIPAFLLWLLSQRGGSR